MATKACWGIDVGQCALKALKLRQSGGEVEAVSFDVIEHAKILSQPDADEQQLIRNALEKFLSRNDVRNDSVIVGVPGQASFSRFIKLPPVELRRVPEIVRYEAGQQIPFSLDEVIWDYQTMTMPTGGPAELEVGIFAMKRDIVQDYINDFTQVRITPDTVQMAPVALYNFLKYDRHDGAGATLLIDVGAENTSLVVADGYRVWIRNFPLGGNNFTQALVKSFKLTFAKAENLKRHAAESKYAREVFQAMRPVFQDLLTEIQRSVGFYTSLHRESRVERVLALGNTFQLPGLQKFLSQNLGVEVQKLQRFNSLHGDQVTGAPVFKENILSFGTSYGLALQGLGLGTINTSLLPPEILKEKEVRKKKPFVIGSAAAVVIGCALLGWAAYKQAAALVDVPTTPRPPLGEIDTDEAMLSGVSSFVDRNEQYAREFSEQAEKLVATQQDVDVYLDLVGASADDGRPAPEKSREYQELWYKIIDEVWAALPRGEEEAYREYNPAPDAENPIPWRQLGVVELLSLRGRFDQAVPEDDSPAGGTAAGDAVEGTPLLVVRLQGTTPIPTGERGAVIVQQRLISRLSQVPYFQKVSQTGAGPVYSQVPDYPYEQRDGSKRPPRRSDGVRGGVELTPEEAAEFGAPVEGEPDGKEQEETRRNPYRGDDYWFELTWHINLDDLDEPVEYSGVAAGAGDETEFGYPGDEGGASFRGGQPPEGYRGR